MNLLRDALASALLFSILLFPLDFLFDGLGISRFSSYRDAYHGSMAWMQYRVTLRPLPAPPRSAPDHTFTTLRYGFNLAHHAELPAQLLQAEIPAADLGPVLYDTTQFVRFSPDSLYYAWVGLRSNHYAFAVGARPVFVVQSYRAVLAPASVPNYPVQTAWRQPLRYYAWLCLTATFWFVAAGVAVLRVPRYTGLADRLAGFGLVLAFGLAVGYVDWLDYTSGDEWPIFTPFVALALLLAYGYQLRQPLESDDEEAAAVAPVSQ